jgi:hypothetical protein
MRVVEMDGNSVASLRTGDGCTEDGLLQLCSSLQAALRVRSGGYSSRTDVNHLAFPRNACEDSESSRECSSWSSYSSNSSLAEELSLAELCYARRWVSSVHEQEQPATLDGDSHTRHAFLSRENELDEIAFDFQNYEYVELALPPQARRPHDQVAFQHFWSTTLSNLSTLVALRLVAHYHLIASVDGREIELDDASMLSGCEHLSLLRIHANMDMMRAHAVECSHCAVHAARTGPRCARKADGVSGCVFGRAAWEDWWCRAMCLAEYADFLARHAAKESHSNLECESDGFDLAFLLD